MTIHGRDIQEKCFKDEEKLHTQVTELFNNYSNDPHFIAQAMNHLFNKPVQYILAMDPDTIHCWIKSVEETRLTWMYVESVKKDSILQFLWLHGTQKIEPKPTESSNSHQDQSNAAQRTSTHTIPTSSLQQSSPTTIGQEVTFSLQKSKRLPLVPKQQQRNLRQIL
jgi:hypothetical protein